MRLSARLALLFLALAATLVLAAGIAIVMRNELATGIVIRELASRGTNARLQVSNLTWNEAVIQDIEVEELRISRLHLSYSLSELLNGQVRTADIEGLGLSVDLTGDAPPLEGLRRLFSEFSDTSQQVDESATALPPLPIVTLEDAQIAVLLAEREIVLNLLGALHPNDTGGDIQLSFGTDSDPFLASGDFNLLVEGTAISSLAATANVSDRTQSILFTVSALSAPLNMERPTIQLRISGGGDINTLAAYTAAEVANHIAGGMFHASLEGTVSAPLQSEDLLGSAQSEMTFTLALDQLSIENPGGVPAWMLDGINAEFSGSASLHDAALEGALVAGVSYAEHSATLQFNAAEAQAIFADDYSLDSIDLNLFGAVLANIPTPYAMLDTVALEGSLTNLASGTSGSLEFQATARDLNLASLAAQGAAVRGRATLAAHAEGYLAALDGPAQISLTALGLPALHPIEDLTGQMLAATLELNTQGEEISFRQSAQLRLPRLSLAIERQDAPPLPIEVESGPIDVESNGTASGPIRFGAATDLPTIEISELGVLAQDTALDVEGIVGGEINASLIGGTVSHNVDSPFFVPLTPNMRLVQNGNDVSFAGDLRGPEDILVVSIEGSHDLASGAGNMRGFVDELSFVAGQTPSNSVSALLASLQNLRGRVEGEANFSWSQDGIDTNGGLRTERLSFRQNGMTIENLATELNFDSLLPPRSLPNQHLTIGRIDTGFEDIDMLDLRYRLDARDDGTPRIYTETLSMNILGGRIFAEGGTIDPAIGESDIPLQAENLDLARLLAHIGLEELTGEGQLNGTIPIRVGAGGAAIEVAALQAGSAGFVAYRSPRAREALASGGDAVNLMLDALEDFHYDNLSLTLSKPVAGDTQIVLRMEGRNPTLLEGHPFDINLSLTGDADPLLQALLTGQRLSNQLLRSITVQ